MEYINKVTLQGIIGSCKVNPMGTRFSLCVNETFTGSNGEIIIQSNWLSCVYIGTETLEQGDKVRVEGRIRTTRYTGADGQERIITEILTSNITKIYE